LKKNSRYISFGVVIRLLAELPINRGCNSARDTEMFTFDIPARAHTFSYTVATRSYFFQLEAARDWRLLLTTILCWG